MPRAQFARRACIGLASAAVVLLALVSSVGATSTAQRGLYVALGDSISAGNGASSAAKSEVQLYYGYLQSNGSGVTDVLNTSRAGVTSTGLRDEQLARAVNAIKDSTTWDAKAVTIDIGINDVKGFDPNCPTANAAGCPLANNLRTILTQLNTALAANPGEETVQVMEYYNPDLGTPSESATRQLLLGTDGVVNCAGTGAALGLNDLIHCISIELGATTVDVLPAFDAAGGAWLAADHVHPNDAGHLAIAQAFGGAATPIAPPAPPPPLTLRATKPKLSRATAGKPLTAWMLVRNARTGKGVKGRIACQGSLSGKPVRAMSHASASTGRSSCTWRMPAAAHNKQFRGSITSRFRGAKVSRSFFTKVR
jgi:lysophospholipase L1-like esterase